MQHASLVAFLAGDLSAEALAAEVADEVAAFDSTLRETRNGRIVVSDGLMFRITRQGARRLLEAVLNHQIPPRTAVYLADCIHASKHIEFADQPTRDAIAVLEDDSGFHIGQRSIWTQEQLLEALALVQERPR
jgi:hypothetical protein